MDDPAKEKRDAVRLALGEDTNASDEMIDRFLRATGGNVKLSSHRIQETLEWHKRIDPGRIGCPACPREPCAHYMHVACYDVRGRPVIYSCMALAQNKRYQDNLDHVLATLETCVLLLPPGESMWSWILDFKGFGVKDVSLAPLAKTFLQILADHYPERLARFFVVDAPSVFSQLWKLVSPFIDAKTRTKIAFLPGPKQPHALLDGLREFFDEETLEWLHEEMLDCRHSKKGGKFYDYKAVSELGEDDGDGASNGHCNLGSPAFLRHLREMAKKGSLPPQYSRHARVS